MNDLQKYERSFDYENWINYLDNFRETKLIPLDKSDIELLLSNSKPFQNIIVPDSLLYLQQRIELACDGFPFPWFLRLGSRRFRFIFSFFFFAYKTLTFSPKDSSTCRVDNINQVLVILLESERIKEGIYQFESPVHFECLFFTRIDLEDYLENDLPATIVIQKWENKIDSKYELRGFVFKKKLGTFLLYYNCVKISSELINPYFL